MDITFHGNALSIFKSGVILTGDSGCGKSELTLSLINRGHKFIADDQVIINKDNMLITPYPQSFVHIKDIGFIDIIKTYGIDTIVKSIKLSVIINLVNTNIPINDSFDKQVITTNINGKDIPTFNLYTSNNRPLDLLVELIIKKQQQLYRGYDSDKIFIELSNSNLSSQIKDT